jgi:metal-responsive CopG/Arc/MetJ family transcriptional regulator
MEERTIQLSDDLAKLVDDYLKEHPEETLSSLIRDVLEIKVTRRNLGKLLELSGIVTEDISNPVNN